MRTIRFRAWDKNKKIMVYDGDTKWMPNAYPVLITNLGIKFCKKLDHDTSIKDENGIVGYTDWELDKFSWENIELMQFTGLTDKNGKEIYEGDIIGYPNLKIKRIVEFGNDIPVEVDEYTEKISGFYLKEIGSGSTALYSLKGNNLEIIGNIYKNTELLK